METRGITSDIYVVQIKKPSSVFCQTRTVEVLHGVLANASYLFNMEANASST